MVPWTLYRFIIRELLKVMTLAAAVLVLLISFAAAIKPLTDGLLGPMALLKFIFYFIPTTLQFALPFAAAFASVLVFVRMAADNEILACSASGLSYRLILLPVLGLGAALAALLGGLGSYLVPTFYHAAEQLVQRDFIRAVVQQVHNREAVDALGNFLLYADAADDSHPPPHLPHSSVQPSKLVMLRGVVLGQMEGKNKIRSDSTAEKADLLLFHTQGATWATVHLTNVTYYDPEQNRLDSVRSWKSPPIRLPSPFRDSPRFMSLSELLRMRADPQRYDQVAQARDNLMQAMVSQQVLQLVQNKLQNPGQGPLVLPGPEDESFEIQAAAVKAKGEQLLLEGPITVRYLYSGLIKRQLDAARGEVTVDASDPGAEPILAFRFHNARISDKSTGQSNERLTVNLPHCTWPEPVLATLSQAPLASLAAQAQQASFVGSDDVAKANERLGTMIAKVLRSVRGQLHQRVATAASCLLVLLLGALLSVQMRGSMPLVVYFWSFLLAASALILTRSGENVLGSLHIDPLLGLAVIWSGNLLLLLAAGMSYWRISRY